MGFLLAAAPALAAGTDVPLTGVPVATFGPGHLQVTVSGVGLLTQPASFSIVVPAGATIEAAYLYVLGRGAGDPDILLNGTPVTVPVVASAGPLPFDPSQSTDTQRTDVSGLIGPGTTMFTVDGYDQSTPGGAFAVVVYRHASAPVQTITLLEGADYAFHGFAPPFGPNTDVGRFLVTPTTNARTGTLHLMLHDTQPDRGDGIWALSADSAVTPIPADLVGGASGATALEVDLLGVPVASGGFSPSPQLDLFASPITVPAGADYVAFQVESPPDRGTNPLRGDSVVESAAVLALEAAPVCGDGVVDPGEQCDDGEHNSDTTPDACRTDCTLPRCGDGVVDDGEQCEPPSTSTCDEQCQRREDCHNLEDENGDGLIDCEDPDCNCGPIGKDPAVIRFRDGRPDVLKVHGRFIPMGTVEPPTEAIGLLITNANGVVYRTQLEPGALAAGRNRFSFKDPSALSGGGAHDGLFKLHIRRFPQKGFYTFQITVFADLSAATEPLMALQWHVGDEGFINIGAWRATSPNPGWRLDFPRSP